MRLGELKVPKLLQHVLVVVAFASCGISENYLQVKTGREAVAANCDETGKCIKDPSGLVLYISEVITENLVLKQRASSETLLTKIMNLVDEPKLLITSNKLRPLVRGIALVGENEPCESPKGIDGSNPTVSQIRSLNQGRYDKWGQPTD